jgi:hypothetical protein
MVFSGGREPHGNQLHGRGDNLLSLLFGNAFYSLQRLFGDISDRLDGVMARLLQLLHVHCCHALTLNTAHEWLDIQTWRQHKW